MLGTSCVWYGKTLSFVSNSWSMAPSCPSACPPEHFGSDRSEDTDGLSLQLLKRIHNNNNNWKIFLKVGPQLVVASCEVGAAWRLASLGAALLKRRKKFPLISSYVSPVRSFSWIHTLTMRRSSIVYLLVSAITQRFRIDNNHLINPRGEKFGLQPKHKYSLTLSEKWETNATTWRGKISLSAYE